VRAADERRLLVYSTAAADEARLSATSVGGAIPEEPGPFAAVAVNNGAGGKLDYYLRRRLTYSSTGCVVGERTSRIAVELTNTAPARGLPYYVTLRVDAGGEADAPGQPAGTNVSLVQVYAAQGAELIGATLDGKPLLVTAGRERSHPVYQFQVTLGPGKTSRAVLDVSEPAGPATDPSGFEQPLVLKTDRSVDLRHC
jgi:hypothetical protein